MNLHQEEFRYLRSSESLRDTGFCVWELLRESSRISDKGVKVQENETRFTCFCTKDTRVSVKHRKIVIKVFRMFEDFFFPFPNQ